MFQDTALLPWLTALENVNLVLSDKKSTLPIAQEWLARVGLENEFNAFTSTLSGGMRQRAAFLRTYLMGNDAVLLDEPFSALDALTRTELRQWYAHMAVELGLASVVITHDVDEAVSLASRVYVLKGNPSGGVPSSIVAQVDVPRPTDGEPFELSHAFVDAKREVFSHLG